jgi:hypothetical protein
VRARAENVLGTRFSRLQILVCLAVVVREAALFELRFFSRPGVTILVAGRGWKVTTVGCQECVDLIC